MGKFGVGETVSKNSLFHILQVNDLYFFMFKRREIDMLSKIKSEVICMIDEKEYQFKDGLIAYQQIKGKYSISSIYVRDNSIVLELNAIQDSSNWKKEYEEQFGEEPSFFLGERFSEFISYRSRWLWLMLARSMGYNDISFLMINY